MRILFDANVPVPLARLLPGCNVATAADEGWNRLGDAELLTAAVAAGFECFLTCDQNIPHQQDLAAFDIRVVVLNTNSWAAIRASADAIAGALQEVERDDVRFRLLAIAPRRAR